MSTLQTLIIVAALLAGPLALAPLERNLEPYVLVLGMIAVTLGRQWEPQLLRKVVMEPLPITLTVMAGGLLFHVFRPALDQGFSRMRSRLPRPLLIGFLVLSLALLSSVVTAVVAALMLVEAVALLGLGPMKRTQIVVLGCFAIGLGSALTPIGEPLATLASSEMNLPFGGLSRLLAHWVLPGVVAVSVLSAFCARGQYDSIGDGSHVQERPAQAVMQGIRIFAFVAGLILVGEACAPVASRYVGMLSNTSLFWANIISSSLDNATLVVIEFHQIEPARARAALLSLLVSGGMLIQGNVPNIVCGEQFLKIRSSDCRSESRAQQN
jgi:predicted cation transporter